MISVSGLSHTHPGAATGFLDVSFDVPAGTTAALVGDNGVGKTTLLRVLAGELEPDTGSAAVRGTVGYMPQEVGVDAGPVDVRALLASFAPPPLDEVDAGIRAATAALDTGDADAGIRIGELYGRWGDLGGYELEALWDVACQRVLGGGIDEASGRDAASLSGGERKQLVLEVLLGSSLDVLLLDEPDNYLDVPATVVLEERLRTSTKTILLISHDRELLAHAPTRIVTLEHGGTWVHHGGWSTYEEAYATRQERLGDELQRWEDEERRLRDLVRILKERARYSDVFAPKARAAESRWRRFVDGGPPPPPVPAQKVTIRLAGRESGRRIARVHQLAVPGLVRPFDEDLRLGDPGRARRAQRDRQDPPAACPAGSDQPRGRRRPGRARCRRGCRLLRPGDRQPRPRRADAPGRRRGRDRQPRAGHAGAGPIRAGRRRDPALRDAVRRSEGPAGDPAARTRRHQPAAAGRADGQPRHRLQPGTGDRAGGLPRGGRGRVARPGVPTQRSTASSTSTRTGTCTRSPTPTPPSRRCWTGSARSAPPAADA